MARNQLAFLFSILTLAAALSGCSGGDASSTPQAAKNSAPLLYPLGSSAATATPPAGALGLQSLNLQFTATAQAQAVLVYEQAFTGTFTVTHSCQAAAGAATGAVPATGLFAAAATTATGPGAVLTVTAGATGGTCSFTVNDGGTGQAVLFTGTTLTAGKIQ